MFRFQKAEGVDMDFDVKSALIGGALVAVVAKGGIALPEEPVCLSVQAGQTMGSLCLNFSSVSDDVNTSNSNTSDSSVPNAPGLEGYLQSMPSEPPVSPPSDGVPAPGNSDDPDIERKIEERVKAMRDPCNEDSIFQKGNQLNWNPTLVLPTCI